MEFPWQRCIRDRNSPMILGVKNGIIRLLLIGIITSQTSSVTERFRTENSSWTQWLLYPGIASTVTVALHLAARFPWGGAAFVGFVVWPLLGTLVTADDDMPGGFSNPSGNIRPAWRRAEYWAQISFGCIVSFVIAALDDAYRRPLFEILTAIFLAILLLICGSMRIRRAMTKAEVSDLIKSFVDGTCGKWDWDDFTSIRQRDPEIEQIRQKLLVLPEKYPPEKLGGYCSEEGRKVLLDIAGSIINEQS